uniref:Uncharacterized protein n=1 Tax=Anguilla anguilla TaxID=7936 RepID=A0A0E9PRP3_ANGAN
MNKYSLNYNCTLHVSMQAKSKHLHKL